MKKFWNENKGIIIFATVMFVIISTLVGFAINESVKHQKWLDSLSPEELAAYKAVVEETIANGGAAASEYDVLVAFATRLYAHQEEMMAISAEVNEGTLTAEAATDRFIQLANDSSATYEEIAATEWTEENIDAAQTLLDGADQFVSGAVYYAEAAANNDDSLVAEGTAYLEEYKATMETFVSLMEG